MIILGQDIPDLMAVLSAGIMGFPKRYSLVCFAKPQIRVRDSPMDRLLADLRVCVLRQQHKGLLQKLQCALKQGLVPAVKAKRAVQRGALCDDLKGVRILLERLFRLRKSIPILAAAVFLQTLYRRFQPVILYFITKQYVYGGVKPHTTEVACFQGFSPRTAFLPYSQSSAPTMLDRQCRTQAN